MIVIFDLEATCWHRSESENKISEIIEIGAIKFDEKTNTIIDEFNIFLTPMLNTSLSEYCIELTTITQNDVDNGVCFFTAMNRFNNWIGNVDKILSWGFYDKSQIKRESFLKKYDGDLLQKLEKKHFSLKHEFGKIFGCKPPGINIALNMIGLDFKGIHHRGIDDTKNILEIYKKVNSKLKI